MTDPFFLPGVPADQVRAAFARAAGNEIASGKFASPESSAALAANAFGWFLEKPWLLPSFPGLADLDWPARKVELECCMRFPWSGGRHPWLDAGIETTRHLIGVESKRFEPFRARKPGTFSEAYDRPEWGIGMAPFAAMRDRLRAGEGGYRHLDAVQLVKHAFGLVTEGQRRGRKPVLLYLFAEPAILRGKPIPAEALAVHRAEIADFAYRVTGAEVRFAACSYAEWLMGFGAVSDHAHALAQTFAP